MDEQGPGRLIERHRRLRGRRGRVQIPQTELGLGNAHLGGVVVAGLAIGLERLRVQPEGRQRVALSQARLRAAGGLPQGGLEVGEGLICESESPEIDLPQLDPRVGPGRRDVGVLGQGPEHRLLVP